MSPRYTFVVEWDHHEGAYRDQTREEEDDERRNACLPEAEETKYKDGNKDRIIIVPRYIERYERY